MEAVHLIHELARRRVEERLAGSLAAYPARGLRAGCPLERLAARIAARRRRRATSIAAPLAS